MGAACAGSDKADLESEIRLDHVNNKLLTTLQKKSLEIMLTKALYSENSDENGDYSDSDKRDADRPGMF